MPPEQQNTGYNPGQYDFIVNPEQSPKKPLIPNIGGGSSFKKKIILIVGGALILIVLMWIVGNILGGSRVNTADIVTLVQQQQEIARVSAEGANTSRADIRNASANTRLSLYSQQQEWLQFLAQDGTEVDKERRGLLQNATTDQELADARASNTFDTAYLNVMQSYLNDYVSTLQADYRKATSNTGRALLEKHFNQTQILLEQMPKS